MPLLEHLWKSLGSAQQHGLTPYALALATLAPAALVATALQHWLALPGSLLLVGLLMAGFAVYAAAVTPLLVDEEATARQRSLTGAIDHAEAPMATLLVAGAATGVVIGAALELRLFPGFLVLGLLALTFAAIVRERRGPLSALRRGFSLTQGNAIAFAALGAIIGSVALGIYAFLAFVLEPLPLFVGEFLAVGATATLAAPTAAHAFVRAFDGRVEGRRLVVRPAPGTGAAANAHASAIGRSALEHTLAHFTDGRPGQAQRVSFTARPHVDSARLRYSPDVASQTLTAPSRHAHRPVMPAWAQTVDEATVEELHSFV
jgi:hypothetical protein